VKENPIYLGKVTKIIMGQSPSSDAYNTEKKGLPFLQGCAEFGDIYPAPVKYCSIPLKVAPKGAVLVSVRAPVGDINIADQDYIIGRGLAAISGTSINQDLLPYLLDFVKPQLRQVAQGSTFEAISFDDLDKCLLPDLGNEKEQSKIAEVLTTIDRAIAQTEALIAKHQRIKTGLMQDLLTRGIDEHGQLRDLSTHKFKSTPLGMIPVEWEVIQLKRAYKTPIRDFGSFSMTNLIDFIDSGVVFIKSEMIEEENLNSKNVMHISPEVHQALKKSWVYPGNILYSKIGSALGNALVYDGRYGVCNSNAAVAKIDVNEKVALSNYIVMVLNSSETRLRLKQSIVSLLPRLNLTDISNFEIRLPSIPEQLRMMEIRQELLNKIANEKAQLNKLVKLKTGLMQDLLSGEVSVTPLLEK
jgi:type I restriction enzyme S subunit